MALYLTESFLVRYHTRPIRIQRHLICDHQSCILCTLHNLTKKTGNIITFAQFEEGNLAENKRNIDEEESIPASIDESSTDDDYDDGSISKNALEGIGCRSQIHPELHARDARFKMRVRIRKTQN